MMPESMTIDQVCHRIGERYSNADGHGTYGALLVRKGGEAADSKTIRFLLTTEKVDSHGSIIRVGGLDFDRYRKNPVILADHMNTVEGTIGRAVSIDVVEDPIRGVELEVEFASGESDLAARVERLARAGFLRGMSIGFAAKRVRFGDQISGSERELLGLPRDGFIVEEAEVMEASIVAVPSNVDTLKRAIERREITQEDADLLGEPLPAAESDEDRADDTPVADPLEAVTASVDGLREGLAGVLAGQDETRQAITAALDGVVEDLRESIGHEIRAVVDALGRVESGLSDLGSERSADVITSLRADVAAAREAASRASDARGKRK